MSLYIAPKQLGIVPAIVVVAPVLIESAWAWYDPDFFTTLWLEADEEVRVVQLNNWWSELEITGRTTLDPNSLAWTQLDGVVAQWAAWKRQYNAATLRRWFSARDWGDELQVWFDKFREISSVVAQAGGIEAERRIAAAGLDPRLLPTADTDFIDRAKAVVSRSIEEAGRRAGKGVGSGLLWPAIAIGASVGILIWLGSQAAPDRKRRRASAL